jgi:hypothetical protein
MKKIGKKKIGKKVSDITGYPWAFVATPAYDGKVDVDYSQALAEAAFCAPLHGVKLTAAVMGNGAFIDLARNIFVKMFLEDNPDCTHLFFIDSDLKFPPNAFIGLMKANLPVCAGVYRRRQDPEDYPLSLAEWPEGGGLWLDGDWVMANRVPTGFLCIRRDVVEEMAADAQKLGIHGQEGAVPRLFYTKLDEDNRFIGEDFCFCDDYVAKYGKPIHVWPNIDFRHGGFDGNLFEWFDKKIGESEKGTSAA